MGDNEMQCSDDGGKLLRVTGSKAKTTIIPRCHEVLFSVDFVELNWHDWVIAPQSFESKRCEGSCLLNVMANIPNTTFHALIQSLQNFVTDGQYPGPCCAPYEMSPMHVFMLDGFGNAVIKEFIDLKVEWCGCY